MPLFSQRRNAVKTRSSSISRIKRARRRYALETLESRTVLSGSTVGVTAAGAVSVAMSSTSTAMLTYDPATHTYTFDDTAGVAEGAVDVAAFNYAVISGTEATLQPINHSTQDFTSVGYTQSAAGVTLDVNSMFVPTTITNAASSADTVTVGNGTTGLAGVTGSVTLTNSASGATAALTITDVGGPAITSTLTATSFATNPPAGIGTVSWTTCSLTALTVDGASHSNTFTVSSTPATITTTLNTGTTSESTTVTGTGSASTLDIVGPSGSDTVNLGTGNAQALTARSLSQVGGALRPLPSTTRPTARAEPSRSGLAP